MIQHALANARLQPDAWARGRALAMLSDFVEEGEQRRALEEALASVAAIPPEESEAWRSRNARASLLGVLRGRLPVDLLETAIERARGIDDASERASALSELAGRLDADACRAVLREALDAVANGTRSEPFQLLAAIVPAELVGELVDAARAIEHPYQRSAALIGVIDRLSPDQRDAVLAAIQADTKLQDDQRPRLLATAARYLSREQLHELVDAVRAIEWDSGRIEIWPTLVPALPSDDRAAALEAALDDADGIDAETAQFAVQDAATIFPLVPDGPRRQRLLVTALDALRRTQDNARHDTLAQLAPLLPPDLLDPALEAARSFIDQEYFWSLHARALIALAQTVPEALPPQELERIRTRAQQLQSGEAREYVLEALARLSRSGNQLGFEGDEGDRLERRKAMHWRRRALRSLSAVIDARRDARELLTEWCETEDPQRLEMLGPRLRGDLGGEAIALALKPDDDFLRGRLLTQLLPYVNPSHKRMIASAVVGLGERAAATFIDDVLEFLPDQQIAATLEMARRFDDRVERARVLAALIPRLDPLQAERVLDEIFDAVEPEEQYRDMLSWYAGFFLMRLADRQVERIEAVARARVDPKQRFDALHAVLPKREDELRRQAALVELQAAAREITEFSDRRDRLAKIAASLAEELPPTRLLDVWQEMIGALGEQRREYLLADIAALAPVIVSLGGPAAVLETARGIRDVEEWWP